MTNHSGKNGKCTVAGVELPITDWSVDPAGENVPFRNSKTGEFTYREGTFKDATLTVNVDYDFDANPFAVPISIDINTELTNVRLYLYGTSGDYWHFPKAIVQTTPQRLAIAGRIDTGFTAAANGPFGKPGSPVV